MSKGFQSPGGRAASDSDAQPKPHASAAAQLTQRLRLSLSSAIDAASLAGEVHRAALLLRHEDGNPTALALSVLAARIERLTDGICSALDDGGVDIAELSEGLYPGDGYAPFDSGDPLYVQELIGQAQREGALQ